MFRPGFVCLACLLFALLPRPAAAKWTALRSTNFLFVGDASEGQIRRVAQKVEQFRDVVARVIPSSAASPVPIVVMVFAEARTFRPYTPQFEGRFVDVAGYLVRGDDIAYIALNADPDFEALAFTTIFHEYAHFMTTNAGGAALPPWAGEGLAQVWETLDERDGGRSAVVGLAARHQIDLLRESTLIPLRELRAVTHDSSLYNEGSRRSVFYAQSWALMHYLMLGNSSRAPQLRAYLAEVRKGVAPEQAFAGAFGADDSQLEKELLQYVRNFTFPAVRYDFDQKIQAAVPERGETVSDAEAQGYLGDLLARLRRPDAARTLLTNTLKASPRAIRPAVSLALLDLREGKPDDALSRLEDVISRAADDGAALDGLGRALVELAEQRTGEAAVALRVRARGILSRAVEKPVPAQTLALLASLEIGDGDPARAVVLLERAIRQAPAREDYRLMAAAALIRRGDLAAATSYLGPLVGGAITPSVRTEARRLLGIVADMRVRTQNTDSTTPAPIADPVSPTNASTESRPAPSTSPTSASRYVLDLRPVGPGEMRVRGLFRGIECEAKRVVVSFDSERGPLRFSAERLDRIDFITYRSQTENRVTCGKLPIAVPALATYRREAQMGPDEGVVVAVELIPDGYTPK